MREQPNIFAAHITLGIAATCQKPSYAHFDVRILTVQYICGSLLNSVFTYAKYRNDNHPDLKMLFEVFLMLFMNT